MTQSARKTTTPATPHASNAEIIAEFITSTTTVPDDVLDQARKCLADSVAVMLGAHDQDAGHAARKVASGWRSQGGAPMLFAGRHAAAPAAFVNATFGHCLDFDDTHFGSLAHLSNPTWAAALALGCHENAEDLDVLKAFIIGFEVAARLGQGEVGQTVTKRGLHSTAIFGRIAATSTASRLLHLQPAGVVNALGAAATQCMGLVASFGTMSKPLHAGKAAMDGILSAELAANGFVSRPDLLEPQGETLAKALVQDESVKFLPIAFNGNWELMQDTFKPYAACNLTHATIETAQKLANTIKGRDITQVITNVHPTVISFAGKRDPQTSLEGKFSNSYCTALGLLGYAATKDDFSAARLNDETIQSLQRKVEVRADDSQSQISASVVINFADGETITAMTPLASGNPGNPLSWAHMEQKFRGLVDPVLGAKAGAELFACCRSFGEAGSLSQLATRVSTPAG